LGGENNLLRGDDEKQKRGGGREFTHSLSGNVMIRKGRRNRGGQGSTKTGRYLLGGRRVRGLGKGLMRVREEADSFVNRKNPPHSGFRQYRGGGGGCSADLTHRRGALGWKISEPRGNAAQG